MKYTIENYIGQECLVKSIDESQCIIQSENGLTLEQLQDLTINTYWIEEPLTMNKIVHFITTLDSKN